MSREILLTDLCNFPQAIDAVVQPPAANTPACPAGDALLPADADLHDVQRVALPDGRPGRRRRLLPVLLEEVGDCGRDGALSLAEEQGRRTRRRSRLNPSLQQ